VLYLLWMAGLTVLLVLTFDRVGHTWQYHKSTSRPRKKQRRRTRAALRAVEAEQEATIAAMRLRESREACRRRDREARETDDRGGEQ